MTDSFFWLTLVITLTGLLWSIYILEYISRVGLLAALSLAEADAQKVSAIPAWAERMKKAHYNAVENLVIFAPLVLIAHSVEVSVVLATQIYFFARLFHFIFYTMGIGLMRTLSFFGGFFAQAYIVVSLLGAL